MKVKSFAMMVLITVAGLFANMPEVLVLSDILLSSESPAMSKVVEKQNNRRAVNLALQEQTLYLKGAKLIHSGEQWKLESGGKVLPLKNWQYGSLGDDITYAEAEINSSFIKNKNKMYSYEVSVRVPWSSRYKRDSEAYVRLYQYEKIQGLVDSLKENSFLVRSNTVQFQTLYIHSDFSHRKIGYTYYFVIKK